MEFGKISIKGEGVYSIVNILSGLRFEAQVGELYINKLDNAAVLIREEYFERIGSTLLSVAIIKFISDEIVEIEITAGGGKDSLLFSFGAEIAENRRVVSEVIDICKEKGWSVISIEPKELAQTALQSAIDSIKNKIGKLAGK